MEYVEAFLLQVMNDEFEVNVEDSSGEEIAAKIVGLRKQTLQGDFGTVDEMLRMRGIQIGIAMMWRRGMVMVMRRWGMRPLR